MPIPRDQNCHRSYEITNVIPMRIRVNILDRLLGPCLRQVPTDNQISHECSVVIVRRRRIAMIERTPRTTILRVIDLH